MNISAILVSGWPHHGKTIFVNNYISYFSSVKKINTDCMFLEYAQTVPMENFDISLHLRSNLLQKELILSIYEKEIKKIIDDYDGEYLEIISEGFLHNFLLEDVKELFKKLGANTITHWDMIEHGFMHDNKHFSYCVNRKEFDKNVLDETIKSLKKHEFEKIKNKITYQSFEEFNHVSASNSLEKFKCGEYPLLEHKKILDIGCNSGYFCFKLADNNKVIGIDTNNGFIESAIFLNNHIYKKKNIQFFIKDFFEFDEKNFDLISCLSIFHYFSVQNKVLFFNIIHEKLNTNGLLVIEIEENNENILMKEIERPAGGKFTYPNQQWLENIVNKKFIIEKKNKSIFQPGSMYNRYIYHLRKI